MSEEQVEAIFQHACEGAAESIGSTRVDWQRVVDAIRFLRRSRDDARKDAVACAAAHINAVAQLSEARRLLDDAREPKPVGETCFDAQGIRWYNTSDRERLPFGTKLYAAAPVPAQSAADVAAIAKAVRDIPSRLESLGGQRFAYVKLSEVIDTIYSVAGKQPAVPEAVAKGAADKLALAYGYLWHVNNSTPGYDAPSDYTRPQLTPKDAAYKARGLLRDMLTNDQRGDGINRAAILSATDSEVKNG